MSITASTSSRLVTSRNLHTLPSRRLRNAEVTSQLEPASKACVSILLLLVHGPDIAPPSPVEQLAHEPPTGKELWITACLLTRELLCVLQGGYAVRWGPEAASLYVGASDHNLRVYGAPSVKEDAE